MGLPRQRPDAEEVPVHHDEERGGEGRSEEEVEVAADPTEQGGEGKILLRMAPRRDHRKKGHAVRFR